jgi:four helix bundle protein
MISQISKLKSQNYNSNLKSNNVKIRAYTFSLGIIKLVNHLPNGRAYWCIGDQLVRSATSIGANMIEAQSSSSKREFIKFYEIALKSCNETIYWLNLLNDTFTNKTDVETLIEEANEIGKMLGSSIITLKGRRKI